MTSFVCRKFLLGTWKPGRKIQQFRPFRHNRDTPLLFVQCRHLLCERFPLFRGKVLFGRFEKLRRHAINNLDSQLCVTGTRPA